MFILHNSQKVNNECNGRLIKRGVQEYGTKILYPVYATSFDALQDFEKKEAETEGEEMRYTILYLENSDKSRFYDLKKHVKND